MRFHTAINKFCYQAAFGLPLTVWSENYKHVRPYLGIDDACAAIQLVYDDKLMNKERYNVLTDNIALETIVGIVQSYIQGTKIDFVDTPLVNQYSYNVNFDKIGHRGFEPRNNINEEIGRTLELFK